MSDRIVIRDIKEEDAPFICGTWSQGVFYGSKKDLSIPKEQWFKRFADYMEHTINKGETKVACLETDPDLILGYSVFKQDTLEWVFVKHIYRMQGVASLLVNRPIKDVNHQTITKLGQLLLSKLERKQNGTISAS